MKPQTATVMTASMSGPEDEAVWSVTIDSVTFVCSRLVDSCVTPPWVKVASLLVRSKTTVPVKFRDLLLALYFQLLSL